MPKSIILGAEEFNMRRALVPEQLQPHSYLIMTRKTSAGLILFIVTVVLCSCVFSGESSSLDPAQIRQRLMNSVGDLPWRLKEGYAFSGQFILKATGEETNYQVTYARSLTRWSADFIQKDPSRNIRYVLSGSRAWVSSPEITADINPDLLPYMARFDFPQLYAELLRILAQANRGPLFKIRTMSNEIHVSGKLENGWEATFTFNTVEYFPRRVVVSLADELSTAWLLSATNPNESPLLTRTPRASSEFEILLSDPVDTGSFRYAKRLDFSEHGNIVGTFLLENILPFSEAEQFFNRPPTLPWFESATFSPRSDRAAQLSIYGSSTRLPAFKYRLGIHPWDEWSRISIIVSIWAQLVLWIGNLTPPPSSPRLTALAILAVFLGFLFLLRRRSQFQRTYPWSLFLSGLFIIFLALTALIASIQLHTARYRSLMALHSAIAYAVTGDHSFETRTDRLLRNPAREAPARSMGSLAHSCQAYALAYDIIHPALPRARRMEIEKELFEYGKPLFGAVRGWRSNMAESGVLAAGLGMVGLAVGSEPFIDEAQKVLLKAFEVQPTDGLHPSGPGPGSSALDSTVNLLYALKRTGRGDYYQHPAFQQYVVTNLKMLSPVGTLPLFGDTNLDQSVHLSFFFLKAANHLPQGIGRQCVAAHDLFWKHGQYRATGAMKWSLALFQPILAYFENPYILFQYERALAASPLPDSSAVLGNGQCAILRTGGGADSLFLAMNAPWRNLNSSHRDILTFDLYAYRSLLLHGPGFPGRGSSLYSKSIQTASSNSITLNDESQTGTQSSGITLSLLNQPVFDFVRALADKTYDYGQVQRDIILVRPDKNHPAYFLLTDEVFVMDPETTVQWRLHGRGSFKMEADNLLRWKCTAFYSPNWYSSYVILNAFFPVGMPGSLRSDSGTLYSEYPYLDQDSPSVTLEWANSTRFCAALVPRISRQPKPQFKALEEGFGRIGTTDWISLGTTNTPRKTGAFTHTSQYIVVRNRGNSFPALLMISGLEFQYGSFSLTSTKPVTVSLDGLRGGLLNPRPDTQIEIHSPEIKAGSRFILDGESILAEKAGTLILLLSRQGEHSLLSGL
jgi:hypothetical protein